MSALVSVIIPTHNRAELVARAVESVLGQTYGALECLVIDDGSSDHTWTRLQHLATTDPRVRPLRHDRPRRVSAARNTGLAIARGAYVAFLDDDDRWLPDKLAKQVALLAASPPAVGLVYCWFEYRAGERVLERRCPRLEGRVFEHLLDRQRLGNASTLLLPIAVASAVGGFDVDLPRGNDGDFIRRVALHHEVRCLPEVLVVVDVGHGLPRITDYDRRGAANALVADYAKLRKFAPELERYPRQRAAIYGTIGFHHSLLDEWAVAGRWFARALATRPLAGTTWRPLLRTAKALLRRATRGRATGSRPPGTTKGRA
jgi:glycosyltransferase involved in cell wall biosynthesis